MKIAIVLLLITAAAFAQIPTASTAACGPDGVSVKVKLDESQHTLTERDPGMAQVYSFQDAGTSIGIGYPTVKMAMDGKWVGASRLTSYFSVPVEPRESTIGA
jgi:hypothetical protein